MILFNSIYSHDLRILWSAFDTLLFDAEVINSTKDRKCQESIDGSFQFPPVLPWGVSLGICCYWPLPQEQVRATVEQEEGLNKRQFIPFCITRSLFNAFLLNFLTSMNISDIRQYNLPCQYSHIFGAANLLSKQQHLLGINRVFIIAIFVI